MFRIAEKSDIPQIISLWGQVFGDSRAQVEDFFAAFPACLSYVAVEDGKVVSMIHALPQTLSPDTPAAYLYAVATDESCRGRGLCRGLMAFAEQELAQRGFSCCVLTPGEPRLFSFYENLGYETAFFRHRTPFSGGTPISLEAYAARREELLTVPHPVCTEDFLAYARRLYGLRFYETPGGIAAAGGSYTAEVLPEDLGGAPFAMVKWLGTPRPLENAYLGFSLE